MIKKIPLSEVKMGMCLADNVYTKSGREIFREGFYFTSRNQIIELMDYDIPEVAVDMHRSLIDNQTPQEKERQKNITKKHFEEPDKLFSKIKENIQETKEVFDTGDTIAEDMMKTAREKKPIDTQKVKTQAKNILNSIQKDYIAALAMLELREQSEYLYSHCVNVATMCVLFANYLKFTKEKQFALCQGAFWHDIGKAKISLPLVNNLNKLAEHEAKALQKHTVFGLDILTQNNITDDMIEEIVLYHHQNYDGSGYPPRFPGSYLRRYAAIVAIANQYDNLIQANKLHPTEAVSKIFSMSETAFDPRVVGYFIKVVGVYPIGSLVELSNGVIAMIVAFTQENLLEPIVKTLYHKDPEIKVKEEILSLIDNEICIVAAHTDAQVKKQNVFGV